MVSKTLSWFVKMSVVMVIKLRTVECKIKVFGLFIVFMIALCTHPGK